MIALTLARELKEAGLEWLPALHDFFCSARSFDG
jgi:hypothetical protein